MWLTRPQTRLALPLPLCAKRWQLESPDLVLRLGTKLPSLSTLRAFPNSNPDTSARQKHGMDFTGKGKTSEGKGLTGYPLAKRFSHANPSMLLPSTPLTPIQKSSPSTMPSGDMKKGSLGLPLIPPTHKAGSPPVDSAAGSLPSSPYVDSQESQEMSTYSSKVFRVTFLTLAVSVAVPLLGVTVLLDCPIDPQPISLKEPPLLTGVLEPNTKLRKAERLWENQLVGPESIVNIGDVLFTGTADGKIIKIEDGEIQTIARIGHGPCGGHEDEATCGRPLGMRVGPNNTLFVADAYYGLYEVDPDTGETKTLVSTKTPIEGQKLSFVNDLTVTRDGRKIYFTDSSSKWQRQDYLFLVMEGTDDGRLLEYDTVTKEVKVLMVGLRFPNGVQLSPAEDFVLVQETTMARIRRYYVSGLMKGGADMFVENMPGLPDNIRLSSSGGYWVAMAAVRPNPGFSLLDFLSEKTWIKRMIFKLLSQETVTKFVPKYSLVVELSETGSYKRSFHDPNGVTVAYVSEAHEHNGHLYLGSFCSPYIGRLDLQHV